jgi:glycerol-3-phosphate dehydrogenase
VLPGGDGATAAARRETVFTRGPTGMLTVAGGKLTTYRRIALDALRRIRGELGLRRIDVRPRPLPGAVGFDRVSFPEELDARTRSHLLNLYGSLVTELLAPAEHEPALLEPLHPESPDIAAQAVYARTHEWALGIDDVLRRRTTLALRGLTGDDVVRRVEAALDGAGVRG